ncbi:UPF0481 protein At3g47200-like [Cornus florida]|uniref:UPF0481 protein At3g47200-like n=1 Tax=Cornus florida TaxID=4283 RepID=UPI00289B5620|nr:UPF0481 protein At3g47200-like [Cornus florida]
MWKSMIGNHEEMLNSIISAGGTNSSTSAQSRAQKPQMRIQKVPQILRESKDSGGNFYAPRVVSIGPCHFGEQEDDKKVQHQMYNVKLKMASALVSNDKHKLDELHKELLKKVKQVKDCYDVEIINSTNGYFSNEAAFTWMMLLDGCFILYYIKNFQDEAEMARMGMKTYHVAFVQQDLFLLENQLPFLVLEELMISSSTILTKTEWMGKVTGFIAHNIMVPQNTRHICNIGWMEKVRSFIARCKKTKHSSNTKESPPAHLLELLHKTIVGNESGHEQCTDNWYTFRNVKELKEVGIHLRPAKTSFLTDIHYEHQGLSGRLNLPPITVDDATNAKFMNLIAYEMCPDASDEIWVTSYVCFLDSLIDHADDVKELRSAGILHNHLGSDDEVAKLFNEMGTDLVPQPCAYSFVKHAIQNHYNSKRLNYIAQFKHQHLKNPWTMIALIGGILALFFSGVQTYFQVWSRQSDCDKLCKHIKILEHI